MSRREVSHSCGHIVRENVEPIDLSLSTEPISVPQRCWRCLGERHRPYIYYGDYHILFIGYLDVPSDTLAGDETAHNVAAPASISRTNTRSSHALHLLFVPVFNPRDIPDHDPYSGFTSAQELDAEHTSSPSPRSRSRAANRSAQVIDGVLYTSSDNPGVSMPDFQSTIAASSPAPSREEAVDVATLCNNTNSSSSRITADGHAAQPEPEPAPRKQTNGSSPHFEGSEVEFSGLSIRPDADEGVE